MSKQIGYHTPEATAEHIKQLEGDCPLPFTDVSWHNDTCDSAHNAEYDITVYFPNPQDDIDTFAVKIGEQEECPSFPNLTECIYYFAQKLNIEHLDWKDHESTQQN